MRIDKFGIWFLHKGDEVCWVWWWRRRANKGKKIMSIGFDSSFKSLKELDKFWEKYFEACKSCVERRKN